MNKENEAILVNIVNFNFQGNKYEISVYRRNADHYCTATCFGAADVIVCDGVTPEDALQRHEELLPLAIGCREIHKQGP